MAANEKAGVDKIPFSFSEEQALFLRSLFEETDPTVSMHAPSFRASIGDSSEYIQHLQPGKSMSYAEEVRRYRDMFTFIEGELAKTKGKAVPESFTGLKAEFERLSPQTPTQTGGPGKESVE